MGTGRRGHALAGLALLVASTGAAAAETCTGSLVHASRLEQYDAAILLSVAAIGESERTHLRFGKPDCRRYLYQRESVMCYDVQKRVPVWAVYRLRDRDVIPRERWSAFRTDPRLTARETAQCADYATSGYDRGPLVSPEDMNRSPMAQAYAFYLSNVAPRSPELNQGMWRWLEEAVRAWATRYREVHVVTGSLFARSPIPAVASGRVAIPESFYKIVVRRDGENLAAIAFILPNQMEGLPLPPGTRRPGPQVSAEEADAFLAGHLVSVDAVERAAALNLLPALPAAIKNALASELWPKE